MARRKKHAIPFDKSGGVIVLSLRMMKSSTYLGLMPQAKVLMLLLQEHWRNDKHVDYGIREAAEKIPCDRRTVSKAFNQLQERGFIVCKEPAFFSSRTEAKSRRWQLEWLPFNDKPPTNTWDNWIDGN